jgi:hypothetical protein
VWHRVACRYQRLEETWCRYLEDGGSRFCRNVGKLRDVIFRKTLSTVTAMRISEHMYALYKRLLQRFHLPVTVEHIILLNPVALCRSDLGVSACRAVAQAVSRWLPTAAARIRVRAACGFVLDKAALGQVFSEYFGFPWQWFHQFLHHHNQPGLAQEAIVGHSAEWTQLDSTPLPHYTDELKLIRGFCAVYVQRRSLLLY